MTSLFRSAAQISPNPVPHFFHEADDVWGGRARPVVVEHNRPYAFKAPLARVHLFERRAHPRNRRVLEFLHRGGWLIRGRPARDLADRPDQSASQRVPIAPSGTGLSVVLGIPRASGRE